MKLPAGIKGSVDMGKGLFRKKTRPGTNNRVTPCKAGGPLLLAAVISLTIISACSGENKQRYEAEESLFKARKMGEELSPINLNLEFLEKTLENYRLIVSEHGEKIDRIDGLDEIVVSAQMELSELEFRFGRYYTARTDFMKAYELAKNIPAARANALYSAAFISEAMNDLTAAVADFEQFYTEFLGRESLSETLKMNKRYLITPLKLSELYARTGDEKKSEDWSGAAQKLYLYVIENEEDLKIVREMRFNLLSAYLQGKNWEKSLEKLREMKILYNNQTDMPSLLFLEARIYKDGYNNSLKALELLSRVYKEYPGSGEALSAFLAAGALQLEAGRFDEATKLYETVIEKYGDVQAQAVEASWQLAQIAEAQGEWLDASLRYKSIYTKYPNTLQGFEAPMRIANHYRVKNEKEAAAAAYGRAIEHYNKIISNQIYEETRIMAEEYVVRAYAEQGEWRDAADRLLKLPDKYQNYMRFRENYLKAASIHEKELGDINKAIEILKICIGKYPENGVAAEARKQLERLEGTTQ